MKNKSFFYYLKFISPFVKPYWKTLILSLICTLLFAISNVYIMPLIKDITHEVSSKNLAYFSNHIFNAFLLFSIRLSSKYFQTFIMEKTSYRILLDIRLKLYQIIHYLPSDEYNSKKHGDIVTKLMDDCTKIKDAIFLNFESLLPNALTLIGVTGYLFYLNWQLACLSIFGAPIFILSLRYFSKRLRRVSKQLQQNTADITQMIQESLVNMKILQIYTFENRNIQKFQRIQTRYLTGYMKEIKFKIAREQIDAYIQFVIFLIIIWFGGYQVLNNTLSSSELMSFFTGVILIVDPVVILTKIYSRTFQVTASIERISDLINQDIPAVEDVSTNHQSSVLLNSIEFNNASFQYPSSIEPVLNNISMTINNGDFIGIVGPSGSGKSTLVNLIAKFYTPTSGKIFVDNVDIELLNTKLLREKIAYVPQESLLFRGSVLENCRIGNPDATIEDVTNALKTANAWEFVNDLPNGLLTKIGTQGLQLSGGQRQRLSIARAIISNPSLLILDEATSALDSQSERIIQDSIQALKGQFTIVVIAHRLSTIRNATNIVVIDNGVIVESGTHQELLDNNSTYFKLTQQQSVSSDLQ